MGVDNEKKEKSGMFPGSTVDVVPFSWTGSWFRR